MADMRLKSMCDETLGKLRIVKSADVGANSQEQRYVEELTGLERPAAWLLQPANASAPVDP
jgi:hypothetical protein